MASEKEEEKFHVYLELVFLEVQRRIKIRLIL
jgi:hypothetical protein